MASMTIHVSVWLVTWARIVALVSVLLVLTRRWHTLFNPYSLIWEGGGRKSPPPPLKRFLIPLEWCSFSRFHTAHIFCRGISIFWYSRKKHKSIFFKKLKIDILGQFKVFWSFLPPFSLYWSQATPLDLQTFFLACRSRLNVTWKEQKKTCFENVYFSRF